jgi:hypothetical protein
MFWLGETPLLMANAGVRMVVAALAVLSARSVSASAVVAVTVLVRTAPLASAPASCAWTVMVAPSVVVGTVPSAHCSTWPDGWLKVCDRDVV